MSTASVERIKQLLGAGVQAEAVARAVGVSASYISQLMADEEFSNEIALLRSDSLVASTEHDNKLNAIEGELADKLADILPLMHKPSDLLRAFAIVNRAQRRGVQQQGNSTVNNNFVQIVIPQRVAQNFVLDSSNTLIEADGKPLVTMPSHQLLKTLAGTANNGESYSHVAKYLPKANEGEGTSEGI